MEGQGWPICVWMSPPGRIHSEWRSKREGRSLVDRVRDLIRHIRFSSVTRQQTSGWRLRFARRLKVLARQRFATIETLMAAMIFLKRYVLGSSARGNWLCY